MFRKKIRILVLLLTIVIAMCAQVASASQNYTKEERKEILNTPAVFTTVEGAKYSTELETKYLNMSDAEFKEQLRKNIQNNIEKKAKKTNMKWNIDFVEKIVKSDFPEFYNEIQKQINSGSDKNIEEAITIQDMQINSPDYGILGLKTVTFPIVATNFAGVDLYGFFCKMTWSWDTTKITSVLPSTWGESYSAGFLYKGISSNSGYFINSSSYYKYVKGHFTLEYDGNPIRNYYPWHEITVYKGGTFDWDWDY